MNDFAIGQHESESGDMIRGNSVSECMRTAGVFGNVAANGAGFLAGRIGSEVKTVRFNRAREIRIDQAGLHGGALILQIDFQDAVHAREGDHDAAGAGKCSARKTGARAATHDGDVVLRSKLDDVRNMFGAGRKNYRLGPAFFHGSVVFVEEQVLRSVQDSVLTNKLLKFANESVHLASGAEKVLRSVG